MENKKVINTFCTYITKNMYTYYEEIICEEVGFSDITYILH